MANITATAAGIGTAGDTTLGPVIFLGDGDSDCLSALGYALQVEHAVQASDQQITVTR